MNDASNSKTGLLDNKLNIKTEETCEWYINSPEHYNCFWIYVMDKSNIDGSMPELVQSEIAHYMGWSNTKTHFMLKQAMVELSEALVKHRANLLLTNPEPDHIVEIPSFDVESLNNYNDDTEE